MPHSLLNLTLPNFASGFATIYNIFQQGGLPPGEVSRAVFRDCPLGMSDCNDE